MMVCFVIILTQLFLYYYHIQSKVAMVELEKYTNKCIKIRGNKWRIAKKIEYKNKIKRYNK